MNYYGLPLPQTHQKFAYVHQVPAHTYGHHLFSLNSQRSQV